MQCCYYSVVGTDDVVFGMNVNDGSCWCWNGLSVEAGGRCIEMLRGLEVNAGVLFRYWKKLLYLAVAAFVNFELVGKNYYVALSSNSSPDA